MPANTNQTGKRKIPATAEKYKWKPGQSGNPSGRPKTKPFKDALIKSLNDPTVMRDVIKALIQEAKSGNVPAIKEFADRLDGKSIPDFTEENENISKIVVEFRQ